MSESKRRDLEENSFKGMDYGAFPKFMLLANLAFLEIWEKARCVGIGYFPLNQDTSTSNALGVGLVFEVPEYGKALFDLIKSCDFVPGSGEGFDVTFIEDKNTNSYSLRLSQNFRNTIDRLLDETTKDNYSIIFSNFTAGKTFQTSPQFREIMEMSRHAPIYFAPATNNKIFTNSGFLKKNTQFIDKETINKGTVEELISFTNEDFKPQEMPINPKAIMKLRTARLKRHFAVTMARLQHNVSFKSASKILANTYEGWQILQAACNIVASEWFPDARSPNDSTDFDEVYRMLISSSEPASNRIPLDKNFLLGELENQIAEDMSYLFKQIAPQRNVDIGLLNTLETLGLLR